MVSCLVEQILQDFIGKLILPFWFQSRFGRERMDFWSCLLPLLNSWIRHFKCVLILINSPPSLSNARAYFSLVSILYSYFPHHSLWSWHQLLSYLCDEHLLGIQPINWFCYYLLHFSARIWRRALSLLISGRFLIFKRTNGTWQYTRCSFSSGPLPLYSL